MTDCPNPDGCICWADDQDELSAWLDRAEGLHLLTTDERNDAS